ncbi:MULTISPECIES: hypothetical protein [unclassified Amycolatopsis]|uniref:hypothetical protein n=1 Tax=unclassified Amycolatopsis TaxID=2618356 RepID=UPI002876DC52|nr:MULTISPECIES: hypothetical protein [unclassified Amycolatopsis]MDS0137865.1 chromosome partitioning protein [Amycolatopsis sp. 505]MDS0144222.1 chromosome partitioning protein [Amycolatopsis sp. CM201R]
MVGVEVVIGALIAWAVAKARRAGKALDGIADDVVDAGAAKVRDVVLTKLGDDSSVQKLAAEAAETGEVSERTRKRVELALEAAADDDARFAEALKTALAEARPQGGVVASHGGIAVSSTAEAHDHGTAFGTVGRDVNFGQPRDPRTPDRE